MDEKVQSTAFLNLVEKISRDVGSRCGCPVYERLLPKSNQFSLDKSEENPPYVFAYVQPRERDRLCRIASKAEWAIKAGVGSSKDHMLSKGWYNIDDEYYWDVRAVDDERYEEIIGALSRICQVR